MYAIPAVYPVPLTVPRPPPPRLGRTELAETRRQQLDDVLRGSDQRSLPALLSHLDSELPVELAQLDAQLAQPDDEPERQRRARLVKLQSLLEVREARGVREAEVIGRSGRVGLDVM